MRTMAFGSIGNLVIAVHGTAPPNDPEWDEYMVVLKEAARIGGVERARSLVITEGGAPNSAQRKKVNELLSGRAGLCAVISDSAIVRGVVTALNWYNPMIKAYSPAQMEQAMHYLKVSGKQAQEALAMVGKLKADLAALRGRPPSNER